MQCDVRSTRAIPEDRHAVRIAAERRNVRLDPLQRQLLVEQTEVSGRDVIVRGEVAKDTQPVVDSDDDDVKARYDATVVLLSTTIAVRPAMDPHHGGVQWCGCGDVILSRCEDVEEKAILARVVKGSTETQTAKYILACKTICKVCNSI